ncbi:MAG: hypothetical protein PHH85_13070 [Candidatus Methanoperedens sp.]|nr:hypothetical protein [Candidatus Methanoperedens sp.]
MIKTIVEIRRAYSEFAYKCSINNFFFWAKEGSFPDLPTISKRIKITLSRRPVKIENAVMRVFTVFSVKSLFFQTNSKDKKIGIKTKMRKIKRNFASSLRVSKCFFIIHETLIRANIIVTLQGCSASALNTL